MPSSCHIHCICTISLVLIYSSAIFLYRWQIHRHTQKVTVDNLLCWFGIHGCVPHGILATSSPTRPTRPTSSRGSSRGCYDETAKCGVLPSACLSVCAFIREHKIVSISRPCTQPHAAPQHGDRIVTTDYSDAT